MKVRIWIVIFLACVLPPTVRWFQSPAIAQVGPGAADDEVPPAALLTDRGTELAHFLRVLRRSEAVLGEKHPSLPALRQQIADVKEQLKAWERAPNPFRRSVAQPSDENVADSIPTLNEIDLRQIVLTLAQEVEDLNSRFSAIDDRLKKLEQTTSR